MSECGVLGERGQGANQGTCSDEERCQYTGECKGNYSYIYSTIVKKSHYI